MNATPLKEYLFALFECDFNNDEQFDILKEKLIKANECKKGFKDDKELSSFLGYYINSISSYVKKLETEKEQQIKAIKRLKWGILCFNPYAYNENKKTLDSLETYVRNKTRKAHFYFQPSKSFNPGLLYDNIVSTGYLKDKRKEDFIYYFTGIGHQPKNKLKWEGPGIALAVLLDTLYYDFDKKKNIDWSKVGTIFIGPNAKNMRITLSKTRKRHNIAKVKYGSDHRKSNTSYKKYQEKVDKWLTEGEQAL